MRGNTGAILEGLQASRIDEGTSTFSTKLNAFLKDSPKETQDFVKKALNKIYLGINKDYGGYIEGKRPIIKDNNTFSTMTWKIQSKKGTEYKFYNIMSSYWEGMGTKPLSRSLDGDNYYCLIKDFDDGGAERSYTGWSEQTAPDNNVIVGITTVYTKSQMIDKTVPGDTFRFIVSVPNKSSNIMQNPFVIKKGDMYFFNNGKDGFSVEYDSANKKFSTDIAQGSGYTLRTLYKPSRNSEKVFKQLYSIYNAETKRSEIEKMLNDNKIRISTSYYPGLD